MLRSVKWCALQSQNQQLLCIDGFLKDECGIALTSAATVDTLMIEGSHVRKIRSKAQIITETAPRPLALTEYEGDAIVRLIRKGPSSGNYVIQKDVLNFVEVQFGCLDRCVDGIESSARVCVSTGLEKGSRADGHHI
jgi:hypothetical protein